MVNGRTQLYARTERRIDDLYSQIYNEKLKPWIFLNAGTKLRVEKHDGTLIQYEGVRFGGTQRLVFWSDYFIQPIIENVIVIAFDQTIEECRKNNLDPKPYIDETNSLLAGLIGKVYHCMADIDRNLRGKGNPKSMSRKDVNDEISKMDECLKGHYDASILLASENKKPNRVNNSIKKPYKNRSFFLNPWIITIGGGLIVGIILLSLNRETPSTPVNRQTMNDSPGGTQIDGDIYINETENTIHKSIVVASVTVEVKIISDWDFNGRVANAKAYLAFIKGNNPLLVTSSIGYTAGQTGNGEVVYKGELDMDAKGFDVGKPVSYLKDAEYIQIEFGMMPSDSSVLEGDVICIINNSVRLKFAIPPQKLLNNRIFIRDLSESLQVLNE